MPGLKLFVSNRLEVLADNLADVLKKPLASPLKKEIIVVQSKGMERWVSMQLASRHGICANCRFPFPNSFVHDIFRKILPDIPERSSFDPKIMIWRIMKILPFCLSRPGFESLQIYLRDTEEKLKLFQLAMHIADTFDQYLLFRPKMIFRWEENRENHWQAMLWRQLIEKTEDKRHRASLARCFLKKVQNLSLPLSEDIPKRISVFGISALPRFHMEIFSCLAHITEINLFLANPCREYWGVILSDWERSRKSSLPSHGKINDQELYLESGNTLLASMGTLGRDFFDLLNEFQYEELESFRDIDDNNLLSCIQSDILNLIDRPRIAEGKKRVKSGDLSIQIHSCHSPMREIEVLQDQLLEMFETVPGLMPRDILVMTPDIETYSPYIQAVFDISSTDSRFIPFSIADRNLSKESEIIETFMSVIELCDSRFHASQVLAVLESPAVRRRFGFLDSDLDLIRRWVQDIRIRWGIDVESRRQINLPAFSENTWKAGLERLILGYAVPGHDENLFGNILPYDHIEGGETVVLGKFIEFIEQLFSHVNLLGRSRTLGNWSSHLSDFLEKFFLPEEDQERDMQVIRRILNDLNDMEAESGFDEEIDINVIKCHLRNSFNREDRGFGFIVGGVTFCAMLPMRSIPFKVICMVGMNTAAYPRRSKPLGFDLMSQHPEPGDRSRRNDDRYVFLEAILSARNKLYISYVGQSIQDNTLIPPSVLVSELLDYIEEGFQIPEGNIRDHIFTTHRLQAFSPEYFKESKKLFSYSRENLRTARCIVEPRRESFPYICEKLSEPEEEWKQVSLNDLCQFFGNSAEFLLKRRLGIYLGKKELIVEEHEPFDFKGLERYSLTEKLLKERLAGRDLKKFFPLISASGKLPPGMVGECIFEDLRRGVESFAEQTEGYLQKERLEPLDVDFNIAGFRLTGRMEAIYPERLIQYRYARVKPKDFMTAWIHHLALNVFTVDHYPRTSMLAGLNPKSTDSDWVAWEYASLPESADVLKNLLAIYWAGLSSPLHFFSRSSWEYTVMRQEKEKSFEDALQSARSVWLGNDYSPGECENDYYRLCFKDTDPLDSEFMKNSEEIFGPLLKNRKELE